MKTKKSKKKESINITLSEAELKYLQSLLNYEKSIIETFKPQTARKEKYKKVFEVINSVNTKLNVSSF